MRKSRAQERKEYLEKIYQMNLEADAEYRKEFRDAWTELKDALREHFGRFHVYRNSLRLCPSFYRYPFWSFRWLWFTFTLDLNPVDPPSGAV